MVRSRRRGNVLYAASFRGFKHRNALGYGCVIGYRRTVRENFPPKGPGLRKYYIHPAILESYVGQTMFEAMKGVHSRSGRSGIELRAEELVVLRLVEAYANAAVPRPAKAS
jgi:hypothetical protein